jgi:hypothetical protein
MTMVDVYALPFEENIGYPQKQQVQIDGIAYTLHYRWNTEDDGFAILKIRRNVDDTVIYTSRLVKHNPVEIRDPGTYALLFTIFPYLISETQCTIWVVING